MEQGDAEARVVPLKRRVVHVQPRQRVAGAHQERVGARGVAQIVAVTGAACKGQAFAARDHEINNK